MARVPSRRRRDARRSSWCPFAGHRAVHPNALYPSALEEARRSEHPLATLAQTVLANVAANLRATARMDPEASAEDAMLALIVVMAAAAALGARRLLARSATSRRGHPRSRSRS